jgi:CBS domain-containing protein
MKVSEIMSSNPVTLTDEATVLDAAETMMMEKISVVPVVDAENKLIGLITQSDFVGKEKRVPHALVSIKELLGKQFHNRDIEEIYRESQETPITEVMTKKVISVDKDTTVSELIDLMIKKHLKRIPVLSDEGKLLGIVTRRNLLQAYLLA